MPLLILAILIGIPLTEIYVFIAVGEEIGALNTVILTVLTAIAGMALLRHQGLSVIMQAQERLNAGQSPVKEVMSGVLLALAGLFLLIPGFATDFLGFLLFMPPLRDYLASKIGGMGRFTAHSAHYGQSHYSHHKSGSSTIIDGEYSVVTEEEEKTSDDETPRLKSDNEDNPWGKNT